MSMKKTIIITIIVCLALTPFMFFNITPYNLNLPQLEDTDIQSTDKHQIGIEQGNDSNKPLEPIETDTNTLKAEIQTFGFPNNTQDNNINPVDYPIVVFVISTEEKGELTGLNSTSIMCYTTPIKGGYIWRGSNGSWANFNDLYYSVQASGNKNGITYVKATEYVFGEKTDTIVYVRQIIGISTTTQKYTMKGDMLN